MILVKLDLITKNNKQNGFYIYSPIVKIGESYHWCETIKSENILKLKNVDISKLIIKREIPKEYHIANCLNK